MAGSAAGESGVAAVWVRDVGGVLVTWTLLIAAEFVAVSLAYRSLFAGNWELLLARKLVGPIALAMLVPGAFVAVGLARVASLATTERGARAALMSVTGAVGGILAFGLTGGRHFASPVVRVPAIALLVLCGLGAGHVAPRVARWGEGPWGRRLALAVGISAASLAWYGDGHWLPRLYPAFHAALFAVVLAGSALTIVSWRSLGLLPRGELGLGVSGLLVGLGSIAWAPFAAHRLVRSDNLRFVLVEHAPILGRAVTVAALSAPPVPLEGGDDGPAPTPLEVPRALDWSGRDVVLVSVDALRADHLAAYGYSRSTTPNLDAFAQSAALFEHAYCPTPHTSYSITSMMTGKAMRPLLSLGLGQQSDTWATYLRRYGYKTAAFYPPAVFYIDPERFTAFEETGLGFEYRWVEFTTAQEKVREVERYLTKAEPGPLFLWVHLFEPHEPYVSHPEHPFEGGVSPAVDAYDSEVAYADAAIGELLRVVRQRRPGAVVIVTADHGEEFGEHGGRYHGTTCYEEQVRVPLLIAGPGVTPRHVETVVQTIDLLPTVLSAIGIPRPARVRGRDLGVVLAGSSPDSNDPGLAYAETDDQTLVARGPDRLICARKIAACSLFDVAADPRETHDTGPNEPQRVHELRALTATIERDQGRYEAASVVWPDALRRGLMGERDAAVDVAALLDDASVVVRRKAAEVTFHLASADVIPEARRALDRDEDDEVRRWATLALLRMGEPVSPGAERLAHDPEAKWRRWAALAFAGRGDPRGKSELATWWRQEAPPHPGLDTAEAKDLLAAIVRIRDAEAVPALLESLPYVPLRPAIADALGVIGDTRARAPLFALFRTERYETARPAEARALLALGGGHELLDPLAVFAGLADPMTEALAIADAGSLLVSAHGGASFPRKKDADVSLTVAPGVPLRLWVLAGEEGGVLTGEAAGKPLVDVRSSGVTQRVDLPPSDGSTLRVQLHEEGGMRAVWVVARPTSTPAFLVAHEPDAGVGERDRTSPP